MADKPWKAFERWWAKRVGGRRYPANSGGLIDVESPVWGIQCKNVNLMSFNEICRLATVTKDAAKKMTNDKGELRPRQGIVCMRNRLGKGHLSTDIVVMHIDVFDTLFPTQGGCKCE